MDEFDRIILQWVHHSPQLCLLFSNREENSLLLTVHSVHHFPRGGEVIINHHSLLAQLLVELPHEESWIPVLGQVAGELAWVHGRETKVDVAKSSFDNFETNLFANTHWAVSEDMIVASSSRLPEI